MFTLFKYLVWLVVSLMCLLLATISISEYLVESAIDAPYDAEFARVLANDIQADGAGLRLRPGATELHASDGRDRIFYALRDRDGTIAAGDPQLAAIAATIARGAPPVQDGMIDAEPVRVAALQIADPRNAEATLTIQVAETVNKRKALIEALRTQSVALPELLVLVVGILLIVYGYNFVLRPMQRLRTLIDNRGANDLSPLDPEAATCNR